MLVSKRKRYLSGSDWVINSLDYMMKAATSSGNICQIVLVLNSPLSAQTLKGRLNSFIRQFPVLAGRFARDFKLTPYWKIPASMERDVHLNVSQIADTPSSDVLLRALVQNANSPFPDNDIHLDFHLFTFGDRSALAMRFDHRLFDARGAESFLDLFQKGLNEDTPAVDMTFSSSMELTDWKSKFLAGRNVNRAVIALSKLTPRSLPAHPVSGNGYNYRFMTFDKQETARIYEKASREAGYLMESPFFLAVIIQSIHDLCVARPASGACYLIPATMDLRSGKEPLQELFFNYVSYLFYQIPIEQAGELKGLITLLKQQMYNQVKSGLPRDLATASLLTRIVPLPLFAKLMYLPLNGKIASFAYSHVGKSSYQSDAFMGSSVENIIHMPRVPVQPGIGVFSNRYNDRLNLMITYLDGMVADEDVDAIEAGIRSRIGAAAE